MQLEIGTKVLITTHDWFCTPDGRSCKAVYGTIKGIHNSEITLGVKTNARSTNWYVELGNMTIAGCQIFYVVKTEVCNLGEVSDWSTASGSLTLLTRPSSIYNADS